MPSTSNHPKRTKASQPKLKARSEKDDENAAAAATHSICSLFRSQCSHPPPASATFCSVPNSSVSDNNLHRRRRRRRASERVSNARLLHASCDARKINGTLAWRRRRRSLFRRRARRSRRTSPRAAVDDSQSSTIA